MTANPWGLTPQQCATLNAVATHGSAKLAGKELGISYKTIEQHIWLAKKQMGVGHRILAVLAWDRLNRATE